MIVKVIQFQTSFKADVWRVVKDATKLQRQSLQKDA